LLAYSASLEQVRTTADGKLGFGWQPNHQHTTSIVPQPCARCHPTADGNNLADVRGTYGFGTGRFTFTDGEGVLWDLTRVLDDAGDPLVGFGHEGTSTVPRTIIERALAVVVE
jgi:hypothetical protein